MKGTLQDEMQAYLDNPDSSLQDEMNDYIEQERAKKNKALAEGIQPETIEGKYLQPAYDVLDVVGKGASLLEKPISLSMGAGRSIGKLINDDENPSAPILEELSSPFPTPAGSLTADFAEAGIGTEPILGQVLPDYIRQEFPKAAGVIENISPNNIADMVGSSAYGSKVPDIAAAELAKSGKRTLDAARTALIRGSERDLKFVGELKEQGRLDALAGKVVENKIVRRNINNPEKMVEYLDGINTTETNPITGAREKKVVLAGKLDDLGSKLSASIKKVNKILAEKELFFDTNSFADDIVKELMGESNKVGSGTSYDPVKIKAEVEKYTKSKTPKSLDDINSNRVPFEDLVSIKRGAADNIFKMKKAGYANVDNPTFAEQVAQKIWSKADNEIEKMAESIGDYDIIKNNNEFSDYKKIRELYADKDIAQKHIPTMIEQLIPAGALGTGVALSTGSPYMGVLAAGSYPFARSAVGGVSSKFPSMELSSRANLINPALEDISRLRSGVTGGAMMLRIPMSAKLAMQDPETVYGKISRDFGPQAAEMFRNSRSEDEVRALFRMLNQQDPSKFEQTKYNNIDGHIDPQHKQGAINDLIRDKETPAHVLADKMQMLLHEGKIG